MDKEITVLYICIHIIWVKSLCTAVICWLATNIYVYSVYEGVAGNQAVVKLR